MLYSKYSFVKEASDRSIKPMQLKRIMMRTLREFFVFCNSAHDPNKKKRLWSRQIKTKCQAPNRKNELPSFFLRYIVFNANRDALLLSILTFRLVV